MTEAKRIYLVDAVTGEPVDAELRDAIERQQIDDWRDRWKPAQEQVLRELRQSRVPRDQWPQSRAWNWQSKAEAIDQLLVYRGLCITARGVTQGLMKVNLGHSAQTEGQRGKPAVYVEYLETAPWNRAEFRMTGRLRGVGTALLTAAVDLSEAEGFKGRIGLHSLPQSEGFYRSDMTEVESNRSREGLKYFEMTDEQARAFLEKE